MEKEVEKVDGPKAEDEAVETNAASSRSTNV